MPAKVSGQIESHSKKFPSPQATISQGTRPMYFRAIAASSRFSARPLSASTGSCRVSATLTPNAPGTPQRCRGSGRPPDRCESAPRRRARAAPPPRAIARGVEPGKQHRTGRALLQSRPHCYERIS